MGEQIYGSTNFKLRHLDGSEWSVFTLWTYFYELPDILRENGRITGYLKTVYKLQRLISIEWDEMIVEFLGCLTILLNSRDTKSE
jgi:hypothetical protein